MTVPRRNQSKAQHLHVFMAGEDYADGQFQDEELNLQSDAQIQSSLTFSY